MEDKRPKQNKSKFKVYENDEFRISFSYDILIENISPNPYSFNLKNELGEIIGSGNLDPFTWMAFPPQGIQEYTIDFYNSNDELVNTYHTGLNDIDTGHILLNVKFPMNFVGKNYDISLLDDYVKELKREYKCEIWVYFKGSEKYNFDGKPYGPLRMNDVIPHFNLMTTIYV
jgi:hypothetical protein